MGAPIDSLKAIAHPLRYSILATLADGEYNVGEIEQASGITQPALSQQLAILRNAELVTTRRETKQIYYAIAQDRLDEALAALEALKPHSPANSAIGRGSPSRHTGAAVFARLNI
jgi:DNA-binding transcriptional ArsR family regulator